MSNVTEREIKDYCKQIKHSIVVPKKEKTIIIQKLRDGIEEYIEQHPDASLKDIQSSFGEPPEIAAEYLPTITSKEMKQFTRRKTVIYILLIGLVVLSILFGIIYHLLVEESPGVIKETGKFDSIGQAISTENY